MTLLTSAITSHALEAIEAVLRSNPELANEPVTGWLPIEWAERSGNVYTLVRTARLIGHKFSVEVARAKLRAYVARVSDTEYETIALERVAEMIWSSVFEGRKFLVDRWKRPLIPSERHLDDLHFLCSGSKLGSAEELVRVVKNA
jgi:hypothetical protein